MELIGVLVLDISLLTVGDYNETPAQVTANIGGGPWRGKRDENVGSIYRAFIINIFACILLLSLRYTIVISGIYRNEEMTKGCNSLNERM